MLHAIPSRTKQSPEEMKEIKDAGLSRLHIGMESGSDLVLSYVEKGVTAEEHITGGNMSQLQFPGHFCRLRSFPCSWSPQENDIH
jgi:hypothetical protein